MSYYQSGVAVGVMLVSIRQKIINAVSGQCEAKAKITAGPDIMSSSASSSPDGWGQPRRQIRLMVPICQQFTPMGRLPSQRLFTVIGAFAPIAGRWL